MSSSSDLPHLVNYLKACALVGIATVAAELLHPYTSASNLMMLYLFAVVLSALKLGLRPAILTTVIGTLAFDFFFIPMRLSFTLFDREYLPTFVGLAIVSLVISKLVSTARERADALFEREAETTSLYGLSRDLAAAASDHHALYAAVVRNAEASIAVQAAIFHAVDLIAAPAAASSGMNFTDAELSTIDWSFKNGQRFISPDESVDEEDNLVCLPLVQAGRCLGVLALRGSLPGSGSQRLVEGIVAQTASALQRIELSHQAEQAQIMRTRADFEQALLNSISHDLRTPLVSVTYALSSLLEKQDELSGEARRVLLETAYSEANRLNKFVGNLLDMTRIEAGAILPNSEMCDVQELIGCALHSLEKQIGMRKITVVLPDDQPLVMIDLVLMTQVLVNLLDNALKYSPQESGISITTCCEKSWMVLEVADNGQGIPEQDLKRVFEKFHRIPVPEGAGGTGLGLSICKGFVEAHGGTIEARNRPDGGVRMLVRLPLGVTEV
jgi:two-component system sensor histidine kinase KdpD